jgi:Na+-transporting methylmalonyl-CoA/oxaloacetate decarboxylase gamma subunit
MKSSFLSLVVLSLVCGSAFAQTKVKPNAKPATTKAKVAQPAPATKTTTLNKEVVEEKKKSSFVRLRNEKE